jgi:hypothetical protein
MGFPAAATWVFADAEAKRPERGDCSSRRAAAEPEPEREPEPNPEVDADADTDAGAGAGAGAGAAAAEALDAAGTCTFATPL